MSDADRLSRDRFIARRMAALDATPWFSGGEATRRDLGALFDRLAALPHATAGAATAAGAGGWHLFSARDPEAWFGGPTTIVFADRDRSDPRALEALTDAWSSAGLHHGDDVWLEIDPRDEPLLTALLERGMKVDSVITVGGVGEAFEALRQGPVADPGAEGGLELLEAADIESVLALHRATFETHPEWCWFGAAPAHLERMGATLTDWTRDEAPLDAHWVFRDARGRAIGHVEVSISEEPAFGRVAGIGIVLDPTLRGRGLLRVAWQRCLVVAREAGARVWKGGTSQPAVLSLGARLGRRWHQIGLRRGQDRARSDMILRLRPGLKPLATP